MSLQSPRILKADVVRQFGPAVAFNADDIKARCDEHVERVREQTRRMIVEAHAEAEAIREKARAAGHAEGRTAGHKQAEGEIAARIDAEAEKRTRAAVASAVPAVQVAAESLAAERERWLAEWETLGIRLAVAIAERILRAEVAARPEHVASLVRQTLQMAAGEPEIHLHLHPEDATFITARANEILPAVTSAGRPTVVTDEGVSRGGCVVRTVHGEIDARLETQLARIADELLGGSA
jgi:flagellar assembly protein FliH